QHHSEQSPRATAYLPRVEDGEVVVRISDLVIFEVVFTLQRTYRQPRDVIRDVVLPLIELPGVVLPAKRRWRQIFDLYVSGAVAFADAYHVALITQAGITEIVTFDKEFDAVPGLRL